VNTILGGVASHRGIGPTPIISTAGPAIIATAVSLLTGAGMTAAAGTWAGTVAGCLLFVIIAARQDNELVRGVSRWIRSRR
jgi:hypothetical protein